MADVQKAIDSVLRDEDAMMSGTITDTPGDAGGWTRYGIASRWHPELVSAGYYTDAVDAQDALEIAVRIYNEQYAAPLLLGEVNDQTLATKWLSFAVNASVPTAARAMQYAVNRTSLLSEELALDGQVGPLTIAAINRCMPTSLANSFRLRMVGYYNSICRGNPTQLKFLCGWIDRALR